MERLRANRSWIAAAVSAVALITSYLFFLAPPADFSPETIVAITRGASVPAIAQKLVDAKVIAHPTVLRCILRISGESGSLQTGAYLFSAPQSVVTVAYRLIVGDYQLPPTRITFVEGMTVREAATRIASVLPMLSTDDFLSAASSYEGYLFPDTYFFPPSVDAKLIVTTMRANFEKKIAPLAGDIAASEHSLSDTVVMASLIEKEARSTEARRMIAGILWNRLKLGMPLQVDAVFGYIFNRDTYSPSLNDLKVDSPYNTYTHTGLPPTPIDNPGLDALEAAIHPTKTSYLYYLTDRDGRMHYATTYAGHQANQKNYLP